MIEVKVIVEVPATTPVTTPDELIVATAVFEEIHGLAVAEAVLAVKAVVCPVQADNIPEIDGN